MSVAINDKTELVFSCLLSPNIEKLEQVERMKTFASDTLDCKKKFWRKYIQKETVGLLFFVVVLAASSCFCEEHSMAVEMIFFSSQKRFEYNNKSVINRK